LKTQKFSKNDVLFEVFFLFAYFCFGQLEFELRASCLQSCTSSLSCSGYFGDGRVSQTVFLMFSSNDDLPNLSLSSS
jgi:hypothetical protein